MNPDSVYMTEDINSPRRSVSPTNTIMVPPSLLMGQPPRYDEVYYPRTDKRMISNCLSYKITLIGGNHY